MVVVFGGGCVVIILVFFIVVFTNVDSVVFGGKIGVEAVCTVVDGGALLVVFRVVAAGFLATRQKMKIAKI